MSEEELFFKEHFKEIKQLADNNNKITLACKYIMLKEELKKGYGDSLTELWDNPEDDRWDKEYNPDLLPETLKNKEEKQDE